MREAGSYWYW